MTDESSDASAIYRSTSASPRYGTMSVSPNLGMTYTPATKADHDRDDGRMTLDEAKAALLAKGWTPPPEPEPSAWAMFVVRQSRDSWNRFNDPKAGARFIDRECRPAKESDALAKVLRNFVECYATRSIFSAIGRDALAAYDAMCGKAKP